MNKFLIYKHTQSTLNKMMFIFKIQKKTKQFFISYLYFLIRQKK